MTGHYLVKIIFLALIWISLCNVVSGSDSRRPILRQGRNANGPIKYEAKDIDEDIPIGSTILKVKASEFVASAEINYSVSGDHFAVDSSGVISNAKQLDADTDNNYYEFKVTATVTTTVRVSTKNKNDEFPIFSQDVYTANIDGNASPDTLVTTVVATDKDGDNVRYAFVGGGTQSGQFVIEESIGVIRLHNESTSLNNCDRYALSVTATDDGACCGRTGPNHTSTAVVIVNISGRDENQNVFCGCNAGIEKSALRNDSSPIFNQKMYTAVIPKEELTSLYPFKLLQVTATSDDDKQNLVYSLSGQGIDPENPANSKFDINRSTGEISVRKRLNRDQLNGRSQWRFSVFAQDERGGLGCADVDVKLQDIDDELLFDETNLETSVYENAEIGTSLKTFRVSSGKSNTTRVDFPVTFAIDRASDRHRQFAIDQNGVVTIRRRLDREVNPRHHLNILTFYDSVISKTATATLTVNVQDINDNAPRFLKDYRPVLMENSPPGKLLEIFATDDDDGSKGNGAPFNFQFDPNADEEIFYLFQIEHDSKGANGSGSAILSSRRKFNREKQKEFHIPIVIKDSGQPAMSSTSTLTVVIGDVNDNRMGGAYKYTLAYNYMGQTPGTEVGRVFVEDLDDWDLPDKKFYWADDAKSKEREYFSLDEDTGMLTMLPGTPVGRYHFRFRVSDFKYQHNVSTYNDIVVREISQEAVTNSGSIRISGITDEDFISTLDSSVQPSITVKSKRDKLFEKLVKIFKIEPQSLQIFSVQLRQRRPPITDIRFSARSRSSDKSYFKPAILNSLVLQHRKEIEDYLGINITMIGINECLVENEFCQGSCTNVMHVKTQPYLVNANATALVGVRVENQPECACNARITRQETCQNNTCLNGGSCFENEKSVSCLCPSGFDGPRCQKTIRSFLGGDWAWYPALEMCDNSHLSIEFITIKPEGILLYSGPIAAPKLAENSDFISLELVSGNPRLLIDFGSGTLELVIKLNDTTLDDGHWHRIDIFWDTENVRMLLDGYENATEREDGTGWEVKGVIPPFNEYLDVNWPLQVGGVSHSPMDLSAFQWDHFPHHSKGLSGCIRNLVHNSKVYDLGDPDKLQETNPSWLMSYFHPRDPGGSLRQELIETMCRS